MAVIKSTSKPIALPVAVSMYSCGGYVVSLPTVKTPGVIRSLGAATAGVAGLAGGPVTVVVLVPHAASRRDRTTRHPTSSMPSEVRRPRVLRKTDTMTNDLL